MNVFDFQEHLTKRYEAFTRSFTKIRAHDLQDFIDKEYQKKRYWPDPLLQINPNYQRGESTHDLVKEGTLHPGCEQIFTYSSPEGPKPFKLFRHQQQAIALASENKSYVVTTGTGSGKSLSFFIPIVDRILREKDYDPTGRIRAIIVYPMNALANSQFEEIKQLLEKLPASYPKLAAARYTGQENREERERIATDPPDILLTNYMMLEYILTRKERADKAVVEHGQDLRFFVLDELHTYRGRQGSDVALLTRRLRERLHAQDLLCIGTSATMVSSGSRQKKNEVVAETASTLFGTKVDPENVISETLERVTNSTLGRRQIQTRLPERIREPQPNYTDTEQFKNDPLAIWSELTLGIRLDHDNTPERARPLAIEDAVQQLVNDSGEPPESCRQALEEFLVAAQNLKDSTGRSLFAFKLHQFISGPGRLLTTLEPEGVRQLTLDVQKYAVGRKKEGVELFSTYFCRECGHEFHPVFRKTEDQDKFIARSIDDKPPGDSESVFGFLSPARDDSMYQGNYSDLPDRWLDFTKTEPAPKQYYKKRLPESVKLRPNGTTGAGADFWFIPKTVGFCPHCRHEPNAQANDLNKLSGLSGEGRSSATTILSYEMLEHLFREANPEANGSDIRKLLGFSDNRQDAALQAGHFNDLMFLLLIRAALLRALQDNDGILDVENVAAEAFRALGFGSKAKRSPVQHEYLQRPDLVGPAAKNAERAGRSVLGYRLIYDLRRGWRNNNPNLLQLKLVELDYLDLETLANDPEFNNADGVLQRLGQKGREELLRFLFDHMVATLCIDSIYLDDEYQDNARSNAANYVAERWSFGSEERLETSHSLILKDFGDNKNKQKPNPFFEKATEKSKFIRDLRFASPLLKEHLGLVKAEKLVEVVSQCLQVAQRHGYVDDFEIGRKNQSQIGWRLKGAVLQWKLPPPENSSENSTNQFFKALYRSASDALRREEDYLFQYEAREHTAQVEDFDRKELEARFRFKEEDREAWSKSGGGDRPLRRLPIMFCSPTMELGVDISALNTVYLRNVPPTPANYAQRSGRAGRSGQAALVVTYCAALSPHDQWFFRHMNEMVQGEIRAPVLDLSNQSLIESHLHSIWLSHMTYPLPGGISEILDAESTEKPLMTEVREAVYSSKTVEEATKEGQRVVAAARMTVPESIGEWMTDAFVAETITNAPQRFDEAFGRWRELHGSVQAQMKKADAQIQATNTSKNERENARRRYNDAFNQLAVLLQQSRATSADFYSFRYLASQGFLPGYNFPRLPLMAWIPASRSRYSGRPSSGSMVSRPRFLALSEFGPFSLIYHNGRTFRVTRAKLHLSGSDQVAAEAQLPTTTVRVCPNCGYGHFGTETNPEPSEDVCEHCGHGLKDSSRIDSLYRIETVETTPSNRITVNDEERQRQGFELQTTFEFQKARGSARDRIDQKVHGASGDIAFKLTYSPAATIRRVNLGLRRRSNQSRNGFTINPLTGAWFKDDRDPEEETEEAPDVGTARQRIVPFVEDRRNILILTPEDPLTETAHATLQAALKTAIERLFQIEPSELVVEPLPNRTVRKGFLFYESAEGGAGILNRIATDPSQLPAIARKAIEIIHYEVPDDGLLPVNFFDTEEIFEDGHSICEAGCYRCLLSYFNQPDHDLIDRKDEAVQRLLLEVANGSRATLSPSPTTASTPSSPGPSLLEDWLAQLPEVGVRTPDETSVAINSGEWVADALYRAERILVFLGSAPEDAVAYAKNRGYSPVVFPVDPSQWPAVFADYHSLLPPR